MAQHREVTWLIVVNNATNLSRKDLEISKWVKETSGTKLGAALG